MKVLKIMNFQMIMVIGLFSSHVRLKSVFLFLHGIFLLISRIVIQIERERILIEIRRIRRPFFSNLFVFTNRICLFSPVQWFVTNKSDQTIVS